MNAANCGQILRRPATRIMQDYAILAGFYS